MLETHLEDFDGGLAGVDIAVEGCQLHFTQDGQGEADGRKPSGHQHLQRVSQGGTRAPREANPSRGGLRVIGLLAHDGGRQADLVAVGVPLGLLGPELSRQQVVLLEEPDPAVRIVQHRGDGAPRCDIGRANGERIASLHLALASPGFHGRPLDDVLVEDVAVAGSNAVEHVGRPLHEAGRSVVILLDRHPAEVVSPNVHGGSSTARPVQWHSGPRVGADRTRRSRCRNIRDAADLDQLTSRPLTREAK